MIKRLDTYKHDNCSFSQEESELLDWMWNSHYWIETYHGYFKCEWCKRMFTSEMVINIDFPLCHFNPALLKLFGD